MLVSSEALVGIAMVELGLVIVPGPNMIYLVSRSVAQGRRAGLTSLAGVGVGFLTYLLAATAGLATLFALVPEIRSIFDGTIILSGALSTGAQIAAARALGADLAYLGTRFIATKEGLAPEEYKQMILGSSAGDIVYTPNVSGVNANFMRPSMLANGLDPDAPPGDHVMDMSNEARAWKTVLPEEAAAVSVPSAFLSGLGEKASSEAT